MIRIKYENEKELIDMGIDGTVWLEKNGARVSWSEEKLLSDQDRETIRKLEAKLIAHTNELQDFMRLKRNEWQISRDENSEKESDTIEYYR